MELRTLVKAEKAIVIAEEFQNATPRQVKTLLTRIGYNSKFIINSPTMLVL